MMTAVLDRPKNQKGEPIESESAAALPDRYEVINGEIVEVEPMSAYSAEVANKLNEEFVIYSRAKKTGRSRVELACLIPLPDDRTRTRIPDVAFYSYERWPAERPVPFYGNPIDIVPDLAVEVISPTDIWDDVTDKAHEYLRAGVRLVWVVAPKQKQVHVYTAPEDVVILKASDDLDGGDVLPGFKVNAGSLFPPVAMEPIPSTS